MYARFSHYRIKPKNIEPMVRQVEEDFYPNYLAKLPGLIAHHVVQIAEEEIISLSLWASQDSAEASVAIAVNTPAKTWPIRSMKSSTPAPAESCS